MPQPVPSFNWRLPPLITPKNKTRAGLLSLVLAMAAYLTSNHFHWTTPQVLPLLQIDQIVPLTAWTIWIYQSVFPMVVVAYFFSQDSRNLSRFVYSALLTVAISVTVFVLYPVTYPRGAFPLPEATEALTKAFFKATRDMDDPANCLPSMHVSVVYLASYIYLHEQRGKFLLFFGWATLIAISTLTTKQHYLVDVISGFGLASAVYFFFYRKIELIEKATVSASTATATDRAA
jgi:membrane-associated phospholipid phosphatase